MTHADLVNHIFMLSDGHVNGETMTKREVAQATAAWLRTPGTSYYATLALADGEWLTRLDRLADGGYDYLLPDTREQESRLWAALLAK